MLRIDSIPPYFAMLSGMKRSAMASGSEVLAHGHHGARQRGRARRRSEPERVGGQGGAVGQDRRAASEFPQIVTCVF